MQPGCPQEASAKRAHHNAPGASARSVKGVADSNGYLRGLRQCGLSSFVALVRVTALRTIQKARCTLLVVQHVRALQAIGPPRGGFA